MELTTSHIECRPQFWIYECDEGIDSPQSSGLISDSGTGKYLLSRPEILHKVSVLNDCGKSAVVISKAPGETPAPGILGVGHESLNCLRRRENAALYFLEGPSGCGVEGATVGTGCSAGGDKTTMQFAPCIQSLCLESGGISVPKEVSNYCVSVLKEECLEKRLAEAVCGPYRPSCRKAENVFYPEVLQSRINLAWGQ